MSSYTKTTNFAAKDALITGDPAKKTNGTEVDTEFNNIATAVNSKLDASSGTATNLTISSMATDLAIADGGTGASTAAQALINLGLTATATELNYVDGVTSAIQTQLDAKQSLDATLTAFAGGLTAANKIPYATALDTLGELDYSTDGTFAADSDTKIPSEKAVKTYVTANGASYASTAETQTGSITNKAVTPGGLKGALVFSKNYTVSLAPSGMAAFTQYASAHSFGAIPKMFFAYFECISTEAGYSVGDRIPAMNMDSGNGNSTGAWADATNVGFTTSNRGYITGKSTGTSAVVTLANWKLVLEAWI